MMTSYELCIMGNEWGMEVIGHREQIIISLPGINDSDNIPSIQGQKGGIVNVLMNSYL